MADDDASDESEIDAPPASRKRPVATAMLAGALTGLAEVLEPARRQEAPVIYEMRSPSPDPDELGFAFEDGTVVFTRIEVPTDADTDADE